MQDIKVFLKKENKCSQYGCKRCKNLPEKDNIKWEKKRLIIITGNRPNKHLSILETALV